jgi:aldehyde dehydrogenase (NAD+)
VSTTVGGFEYAAAIESTAGVTIRPRYGLFTGDWNDPAAGAYFNAINPATEETLAEVGYADADDVDRAVRAARRAYDKTWRKMRPSERAKYIYRIARALGERSNELALVETLDSGKPIRETAAFDVPSAASHFFYHAGWADKLAWAVRNPERPRPYGVVGAIVPSNFPLLFAAWKIAPALAAGNTIVLKPSEATSLSALHLAAIAQEADLPGGVINVVTGDARTGAALVEHADVDMISFTGSTETGKLVRRIVAGTHKKLMLSLSGKSATIVYEDAPLSQAIEAIVESIYFNRGHSRSAGARLLVQESIAEEVVLRLRERIESLRLGDPLDRNTDIGAVVSRPVRDRIAELVQSGIDEGAQLIQQSCAAPDRGFFYPASFFTEVQPTYRIAREEICGPVLCVMTFRTPDEAIERANNIPYGLAAAVWTDSGSLALYTAERLAAGVTWCNSVNRFDASAASGGYKESGFGREGGLAGLREYIQIA